MAFIDVNHAINICFLHSSEVLLGSREKYCGIFGHVCRQLRALLNSFSFFLFAIYISAAVCLRQPMQGKARDWWGNKKEFNVGKLYEILDLGSPGRHPVPLLSFYCNESQRCTKRRKGAKWWKYIIIKKNTASDENDKVKWSSFFGCRKASIETLRPITEATL